jgi:hypothetical protein
VDNSAITSKDESDELVRTVRQIIRENRKFLARLDADEPDGEWDDPGQEENGEEEPLPSV